MAAQPKFDFGASGNPAPGFNFQLPTQTPPPTVPPPAPVPPAQVPGQVPQKAAAPIDIMQFFQALQGLYHPDVLGAVARGNARPPGLTPQVQWDQMFTPTSAARQAQMTNHPSATMQQMANAPGNQDPAQTAWDAGHGPSSGPHPGPMLPAPLPGTVAEAKAVGGTLFPNAQGQPSFPAAPTPTNPFAHLFSLFGI